jgi:hypothetical protein
VPAVGPARPVLPLAGPARLAARSLETSGPAWDEVTRLANDQKYQAALDGVGHILARARADGNEADWVRALIETVQLRQGLHGYETAVRFLREERWPEGALGRVALLLYYAQSLQTYVDRYGWEIGRREKVESSQPVDLKKWTREQIYEEAVRALALAHGARELLGDLPLSVLQYVVPGNMPAGVRDTVRDMVTYQLVKLLANTQGWRPEQLNEVYQLDFDRLLQGQHGPALPPRPGAKRTAAAAVVTERDVVNPEVHPLLRIGALLDDLEGWHLRKGRRGAALEARLERIKQMGRHGSGADDTARTRQSLTATLPAFRQDPWWAMGQLQLAGLVSSTGDQVTARQLAREGAAAFPGSPGGAGCQNLIERLEQPDFNLSLSRADGLNRPSLEVTHQQLRTLYFRMYRIDLEKRVRRAKDYNLQPSYHEQQEMLGSRPDVEWKSELPVTSDLRSHRTFIAPKTDRPGAYVLFASMEPGFRRSGKNKVLGANLILGDLVLLLQQQRHNPGAGLEYTALAGGSGRPIAGAEIVLYRYDWRNGHRRVDARKTDGRGMVFFADPELSGSSYFAVAHHGQHVALDPSYRSFYLQSDSSPSGTLIYTDRSIYRPNQTLHFKVLAFQGQNAPGRFSVQAGHKLTVRLHDANSQVVEKRDVTTNDFGTASGTFAIPAGRLLGGWRLEASYPNGQTGFRVEEYKRPTFEARMLPAKEELRLNRPARLHGEARYHFGLPVTSGKVRWRVTRVPVWDYFWFDSDSGYGWSPPTSPQVVQSGTSGLDAEGKFTIDFVPAADERLAAEARAQVSGSGGHRPEVPPVSFRYAVNADITDEGGETRQASKSFRLGFVSVEARVQSERRFLRTTEAGEVVVMRTDLDGQGRAGNATFRLLELAQPAAVRLPADEPRAVPPPPPHGEITAGDRRRPRFDPRYSAARVLRGWGDGRQVLTGSLQHDAMGKAVARLGTLPPGAYRLRYRTTDASGAPYELSHELLVVGPRGLGRLALPYLFLVENPVVKVGERARVLAHSGLAGQTLILDRFRGGRRTARQLLQGSQLIEIPIEAGLRGGFGLSLSTLRDHQLMAETGQVFVPWDDRELQLSFSTFRDRLRPGQKETWTIRVKGGGARGGAEPLAGAVELLAYMYDRSLDLFGSHNPPRVLDMYPSLVGTNWTESTLGRGYTQFSWANNGVPYWALPTPPELAFRSGYGIGGLGHGRGRHLLRLESQAVTRRAPGAPAPAPAPPPPPPAEPRRPQAKESAKKKAADTDHDGVPDAVDKLEEEKPAGKNGAAAAAAPAPVQVRKNFAETAFFMPHLHVDVHGQAEISFTVPESVTSWNVWVHAVTRDLRSGSLHAETRTVKELLVRPYLPRFLREGDQADLKVVVNSAPEPPAKPAEAGTPGRPVATPAPAAAAPAELPGELRFEILDAGTETSRLRSFGLDRARLAAIAPGARMVGDAVVVPFRVKRGGSTSVSFPVTVPRQLGLHAFRVTARAGSFSDGELRPIPVLPSRLHLSQSRFVTLKNVTRKVLAFADMARKDDPSRIDEQLVVTLDAQLFYGVLSALPYLVTYPYECTEQTLNRFVSTGIVSSLYKQYPAVGKMAAQLSTRKTPLETFDAQDPNRKMALEESPWLQQAQGGKTPPGAELVNVLDPRVARADRDEALVKLRKSQTQLGGFPWFPGGPPSPFMTLYLAHGFAKAAEFGAEIPRDVVQRAWSYLGSHLRSDLLQSMRKDNCCWEFLTMLNYVASAYPDPSYLNGAISEKERREILAFSFSHWKRHSPYLKAMLALTLSRMGRPADARLVWSSVMDSSRTTDDQGTFWAPEDRGWLWYNDSIEGHAFALRTMMELEPKDPRRHGLVQWLLIHKKLSQWKSTRATAEVIYALLHYLKREGQLGIREELKVTVGSRQVSFTFEPDRYTGKKNQVVIPGPGLDPRTQSQVVVEKSTPGLAFASATWHFSTEKLPTEERGDLFKVSRRFFKRVPGPRGHSLVPLTEGTQVAVGDQVEAHVSLMARNPAEYVHLRAPRGAGFEPESQVSRYKYDLGLVYYEEVRDSGQNFFFERLPQGEYTFKYRLRATTAGRFRVGPATVQSMYAPEFSAYSTGEVMTVTPARP